MNSPQRLLAAGVLVFTFACLTSPTACHAQFGSGGNSKKATTAAPATPATAPVSAPASQAPMTAEQAAIWNSPNMLRARAWLQEYCATSKNVKPGEAQQYMNELEHMSPTQMKLWLMKFDEEEDQKKQQRDFYKQAQSTMMKQAKATDKATQKSYSEIESEETASANQAQSQIEEQEQNEQQNQDDKEMSGPYTPYGEGIYPGAGGGVHYHFHMYPY
jgi:hypothetical protein